MWPPNATIPPRFGYPDGSVVGRPSSSTSEPGGTCSPFSAATRALEPAIVVVAKSITMGVSSPAGTPMEIGFVCSSGLRPPNGTATGSSDP